MAIHRKDWVNRFLEAIWAYRTTWKTTTSFTLFELLYGKKTMMPIEFEHKTLRTVVELKINLSTIQIERIIQLNNLDEMRKETLHHIEVVQAQHIKWHDKYIKAKQFQPGDWALLYDSWYQEGASKLQTRWLGPYEVAQVFSNGVVELTTINPIRFKLLVKSHCLRLYHKLASKAEFMQQFTTSPIVKGSRPHVHPSS